MNSWNFRCLHDMPTHPCLPNLPNHAFSSSRQQAFDHQGAVSRNRIQVSSPIPTRIYADSGSAKNVHVTVVEFHRGKEVQPMRFQSCVNSPFKLPSPLLSPVSRVGSPSCPLLLSPLRLPEVQQRLQPLGGGRGRQRQGHEVGLRAPGLDGHPAAQEDRPGEQPEGQRERQPLVLQRDAGQTPNTYHLHQMLWL